MAAGSTLKITVSGTDTAGKPIAKLESVRFTSANQAVADVLSSEILGISTGSTSIGINVTHRGVSRTGTASVTVSGSLPASASVVTGDVANTFTPQTVVIARTGTVTYVFGSVEHNVFFTAVTGAPANIPALTRNTSIGRTFSSSGNFPYECNIHAGMTGTVIVR